MSSDGSEVGRATQAYRKLRELIVHGRLAPGTRIIETEIARALDLSRTPVRAALQRLQQEGYIVVPGRGRQNRPSVAPLTREDANELFAVVSRLEGLAAAGSAGMDEEERAPLVRELESTNDELLASSRARRPDQNLIFDLDESFHSAYVRAGSGPRLRALHDAVKPQAERYIRLYISALVDEIGTSVDEHAAIVEAIREGSPARAERAVLTNWRNAADRLSRVIEAMGERGSW